MDLSSPSGGELCVKIRTADRDISRANEIARFGARGYAKGLPEESSRGANFRVGPNKGVGRGPNSPRPANAGVARCNVTRF